MQPDAPVEEVPAAAPAPSLSTRAIGAAQWQSASSVTKVVIQFGVTVLLARLLSPDDFGLAALAFIVVGFAQAVMDLGLGPAIIQRHDLTPRHVRTSFTLSTLIGLGATAVLALGAPLFASLLGNAAVVNVLRVLSILFVLAGIGATARALLERRLDFRGLFFVDLSSYVLGYAPVAIILALLGFGVWSLVWANLLQSLIAVVVSLALGRHSLRPLVARGEMRELLDFGFSVLLNRTVVYASYNGDNFVTGRWLGPSALGLYSRAFQLMSLPLYQLQNVTWNVLFASYSRLQNNRARAASAYLKGVQLTSLVVAPISAGMVVAGPHLIVGLYGPKWTGATLALQVLCAVMLFRSVYSSTGALTHAFGEVYAEFRRQIIYATLVIVGALIGSRWGITGVAVGASAAVGYMYFAMAQVAVRITACSWMDFFRAQLPGVLLAVWVAALAMLVRVSLEAAGFGSGAILGAVILACLLALPAGVYLLPSQFRPVELFGSLAPSVSRLPARIQLPVRMVMRIPPDPLQAAS
jgi:teichuronic acid exporter